MTRKDYELIAEVIRCAPKQGDPDSAEQTIKLSDLTYLFGKVLKEDNPRFDAERFSLACYS